MGVNIFNLIINIYLSTVIVAVIAFVLNFRRLDRSYWNGAMWTDEDFEEYFQGEEDE